MQHTETLINFSRSQAACAVKQQWNRFTVNQKVLSATKHEPAVSCTALPALLHHSRPACVPGSGQGSRHTPGHAADLKVPGRDTAGLSLPAQIQITAATRGNKLQLSRHFPYGSPPPLFTGIYPGAFLSPEMQSPTNAEATLYLLSPFLRSFQWKKSLKITRWVQSSSPKRHTTPASLTCQRQAGKLLADFA